jgi:hypothetical protein
VSVERKESEPSENVPVTDLWHLGSPKRITTLCPVENFYINSLIESAQYFSSTSEIERVKKHKILNVNSFFDTPDAYILVNCGVGSEDKTIYEIAEAI